MTNSLRIGTSDYPYDRDRYRRTFGVVELALGRLSPPNPKTLRRWARDAAETAPGFEHTWVAWHSFTHLHKEIRAGRPLALEQDEREHARGHFQDTPESRRVWQEVVAQAEAAAASVLVLETPASLTPAPANVERIRAFAEWSGLPEAQRIVWDPAGFWDREELLALCADLGWTLAIDPLVDPDEPLPESGPIYFRLRGTQGLGGRYGDWDLERLAELCDDRVGHVVFRNEHALRDASRLAELLGLLPEEESADADDDEPFEGEDTD